MYQPTSIGRDAVEIGQDQRVGEEDGVVEEGLRGHQREADQRALPLRAEAGSRTPRRAACGVRARSRMLAKRPGAQLVARRAEARLDAGNDRLGLVRRGRA